MPLGMLPGYVFHNRFPKFRGNRRQYKARVFRGRQYRRGWKNRENQDAIPCGQGPAARGHFSGGNIYEEQHQGREDEDAEYHARVRKEAGKFLFYYGCYGDNSVHPAPLPAVRS
jgi:hypothetical protein